MTGENVLVTGTTGFVGSALSALLLERGYAVAAAVRRRSQALPGAIAQHVTGDFSAATDWRAALAATDVVIHLASRVHVMAERAGDPLAEFRATNVAATRHLAQQAAAAGVRRFIFISSIGVNGAETAGPPFTEQAQPAPHSHYALSKYEAELAVQEVCAQSAMQFVIIRPPLVYGATAPGNFRRLLKLVASGLPLPLAAVRNARSMISRDNLVDFIARTIGEPRAANQLFLISDGVDLSTPDLIRLMSKGMGRKPRLVWVPPGLMSAAAAALGKRAVYQQLCGTIRIDITKARTLLDWTPPVDAAAGLRRAAEDYEK